MSTQTLEARMVQRYRLRIYDGRYEVLHRDRFMVDVDLDTPAAGAILNTQFTALIDLARIANEPMDRPRMTVHDVKTDAKVMDWVG